MSPRDRERRFRYIKEIGCVACKSRGVYRVPDVHHLNTGGHAGHKRRGDEFTIGLCKWHHVGTPPDGMLVPEYSLGPSLAKQPNRFRQVFGSDDELLARQNKLLREKGKQLVGVHCEW